MKTDPESENESENMSENESENMSEIYDTNTTEKSSSFLSSALDALLDRLGADTASVISGVFGEWAQIVGEQVAQHVTPIKRERGKLIVEVDDPSWATQMRFLEPQLIEKIHIATSSTINAIEVRVKRNPHNR